MTDETNEINNIGNTDSTTEKLKLLLPLSWSLTAIVSLILILTFGVNKELVFEVAIATFNLSLMALVAEVVFLPKHLRRLTQSETYVGWAADERGERYLLLLRLLLTSTFGAVLVSSFAMLTHSLFLPVLVVLFSSSLSFMLLLVISAIVITKQRKNLSIRD